MVEGQGLRQKIKQIQDCQGELESLFLKEEKFSSRCFALENQLLDFGSAIATLQKTLSDTQAQLNYERTTAKQLEIENQYLKFKVKEQERSIHALSRLLWTDHMSIKSVLNNPEVKKLTEQDDIVDRGKSTATSSEGGSESSERSDNTADYVLGRDLEKMRNVAKEMGAVFLRDRELIQEEREAERSLMEEKLRKLNEGLFNTQEELRKISRLYTDLRVSDATALKQWESEKVACLSKMKSLSSVSSNEDALLIVQSLAEILDPRKSSGVVARLKKEVKQLKALIDEATSIAEQYRTKATTLQNQLDEVRTECEEMSRKCKDEADTAKSQNAKTLERCSKLEDKTKMEFAGYRNEIALLKEELRRAEKKLYFLTLKQSL